MGVGSCLELCIYVIRFVEGALTSVVLYLHFRRLASVVVAEGVGFNVFCLLLRGVHCQRSFSRSLSCVCLPMVFIGCVPRPAAVLVPRWWGLYPFGYVFPRFMLGVGVAASGLCVGFISQVRSCTFRF